MAGVSEATVSRALNNKKDVSKKTKEKILKIIEEHNYIPNSIARNLYTNTSNVVGVIVPDLINPYFPEIIQIIDTTLSDHGYNVMLFNTLNSDDIENKHIRTISSLQLSGLIIIAPNIHSKKFINLDIPVITIDGILNDVIPYITSDFFNGARLAVKKLVENNCKKILHVAGPLLYYSSFERYNGFIEQCKKSEIEFDTVQTKLNTDDYLLIRDYFDKNRDVDGVFAANDSIAFTCIKALAELNIDVPDNVKIIGYDNNFMANVVNPPLSTISVPIIKMGREASLTLLNMIQNKPYQKDHVIEPSYIKRNTTKI
jgi:DNA-binding LacI/PurR family transcriptional regulator